MGAPSLLAGRPGRGGVHPKIATKQGGSCTSMHSIASRCVNAVSLRRTGLEPVTFGSVDRCSKFVSDGPATTYDDADQALTALLTYFSQNWPDLDPDARRRVLAICLEQEDPELRAVVKAWPDLPEAVRAGIVAMVKAAKR